MGLCCVGVGLRWVVWVLGMSQWLKILHKNCIPVGQLFLALIQQPKLSNDDFHFQALTVVLI